MAAVIPEASSMRRIDAQRSNSKVAVATVVAATSAFYFCSRPAAAIQTNWKPAASGNFSVASNWDNGVPDSTKPAGFGLGLGTVSYTVTYNGAASGFPPPQYQCNQLIVSGTNNVTFVKNNLQPVAPSLTATNTDTTFATPGLIVGQYSGENATLNTSVFFSCTSAVIGLSQGATGTLNVGG